MKIILLISSVLFISVSTAQVDNVASGVYYWDDSDSLSIKEILNGETTDLENLKIYAEALEPGKSKLLTNNLENLIIIKDGELNSKIKDSSKILTSGSIAYILPGDEILLQNISENSSVFYVLEYKIKNQFNKQRGMDSCGSFIVEWSDLKFKPHDKGGIRNYFERPTSMFERFEMHVTTLNPGIKSHEPHTHKAAEIVLMIEGNAGMEISETYQEASSGDVIFLGSNVPHALGNIGKKPCMYFAFQWE